MRDQPVQPPSIGDALLSVRAAIDLIESGVARRVTVALADGASLLPAARALSRDAGLTLVATRRDGGGCDIAISREPQELYPGESQRIERHWPRVAS
jgi:hypothetical protein